MDKPKFNQDPRKRFSTRVENYIKYRPKYPQEIILFLKQENILINNSIIADIGSGTGILSELFLKNGNKVYGVEPNQDMRKAAEQLLYNYSDFISISGSAESTELNSDSIDLITVGQAFHWFDIVKARTEFSRILKPDGYVALIWNRRKKQENEFLKDYEKLLIKYGTDYNEIEKRKLNFDLFFGNPNVYKIAHFYNFQVFDFDGLKGRLLSTSYIPLSDSPEHNNMICDLQNLFNLYQKEGEIRFEYDTEVIYGQLK